MVPLGKEHNKNKCKIFLSCEERLGELGLFSQNSKPQSNLIVAFQYLKGDNQIAAEGLVRRARQGGMALNRKNKFRLDSQKKFFTVRVVRYWICLLS